MMNEKESEGNKRIMDTTGSVDTKNPDETNEVVKNIYQNLLVKALQLLELDQLDFLVLTF